MNYLQLLNNPAFSLYLPYAPHLQVHINSNASSNYRLRLPRRHPRHPARDPGGSRGPVGTALPPAGTCCFFSPREKCIPVQLAKRAAGRASRRPDRFPAETLPFVSLSSGFCCGGRGSRYSRDLTAPHKIRGLIPTCSPGAWRPARPRMRPPSRVPRYLCRGLRAMARRARGSVGSRGNRTGLPPPAARRLPASLPGRAAAFRSAGAKFLRSERRRRRSRRRRRRRRRKQVDIKV